jgi:hypothetical protein
LENPYLRLPPTILRKDMETRIVMGTILHPIARNTY